MNDRLLNHPLPPRVADPSVSPQMQEIIYRALERDPKNRYATRRNSSAIWSIPTRSAWKIATRCADWQNRKSPLSRKILYYGSVWRSSPW